MSIQKQLKAEPAQISEIRLLGGIRRLLWPAQSKRQSAVYLALSALMTSVALGFVYLYVEHFESYPILFAMCAICSTIYLYYSIPAEIEILCVDDSCSASSAGQVLEVLRQMSYTSTGKGDHKGIELRPSFDFPVRLEEHRVFVEAHDCTVIVRGPYIAIEALRTRLLRQKLKATPQPITP